MYGPYPYFPPMYGGSQPSTLDEAKKLVKFLKRQEKQDEHHHHHKKGEHQHKGNRLASVFTTFQWFIILCTIGPIAGPWWFYSIVSSYTIAMEGIKALLK